MKTLNPKPSIVVRKICNFLERKGKAYPIPVLLLLANKEGFLWLSKYFADMAKRTPACETDLDDPDDHDHIGRFSSPIDLKRSDEMEVRVGLLTSRNARYVYRKYGISATNADKGDLQKQYAAHVRRVLPIWKWMLTVEKEQELKGEPSVSRARSKRPRRKH